MTTLVGRGRTARTYMAEFGLTGGLMSAAFVAFLMFAVLTTFAVWPAGALLQGGGAELESGGSAVSADPSGGTKLPVTPSPSLADPVGPVRAGGRDHGHRRGSGQTVDRGGLTGLGGGTDIEVTNGGDEIAPTGGSGGGSGSASTPGSSGNGLKLGHSKPSNGNGNKVGHGNTGTSGNGSTGSTTAPGQTKAGKKTKG